MNAKEYGEIRRRLNPEKNTVTQLCGAFVSEKNEILATFNEPTVGLTETEASKYFSCFKRVLSGTAGRNLIPLRFRPDQLGTGEHALLMKLRETALRDEEALNQFYAAVASGMKSETPYAILLIHDVYDVPRKSVSEDPGEIESEEIYSSILCAICPVKPSKEYLSWYPPDTAFRSKEKDMILTAPDTGFLFPAFNDRAADISEVSFYLRDPDSDSSLLLEKLFAAERIETVTEQKEAFSDVLAGSLAEELSYDVAQAVNREMVARLDEARQDKESEVPVITSHEIANTLRQNGVSEEKVTSFEETFADNFGENAVVNVAGVAETKKLEIATPSVRITVAPDAAEMIETRVIDGFRYVLIRADEGVTVNGMPVAIEEEPF